LTGVVVSFLAIVGVGLVSLTFSDSVLDFLAVLFPLTSAVLLTLASEVEFFLAVLFAFELVFLVSFDLADWLVWVV